MDLKLCEASSNLHADVLLPPRKRLLANLKRQSSNSTSNSSESNARMAKIIKEHLDGNPNASPQDIIQSSKTAADVAIKVAQAARSRALEKAAIAVKAIAAAKKALELVATINQEEEEEEEEEENYTSSSSHEKKELEIKRPKHVSVNLLYQNNDYSEEEEDGEQLVFRFPTIANRNPNFVFKSKNPKRIQEREYEKGSDESHSSAPKWTAGDGLKRGRKRGRVKLKRLPLSVCAFRDRMKRNEEMLNVETCVD